MNIRPARMHEAETLTALCLRAKAHWGYDEAFMARVRVELTITPERIARGRVLVAEDGRGLLLGMGAYEPLGEPGIVNLELLFIAPPAMGTGVGRALFGAIAAAAAREGASGLRIEADPHAAGFYERLGALRTGDVPSASLPGRTLPLFEYALVGR
jgi:GNAT superfamily N-acetyltransferase